MTLRCVVAVLAVMLSTHALAQSTVRTFRWEELSASGGPAAREHRIEYDHVDHRLIAFGGGTTDDNTYAFDLNTNTWSTLLTLGTRPKPRFSFVSGMQQDGTNNRFIIATGEGAGDEFFNDIWALNLAPGGNNGTWEELPKAGAVPAVRYGAAGGIWFGDPKYLMVTHGFKGDKRFDDTFAYDLANQQWVAAGSDDPPTARCLHAGTVIHDNQVYIYGGCGSGGYGPCPGNDVHRRVFSGNTPGSTGGWGRGAKSCARPAVRGAMHIAPGNPAGGTVQQLLNLGGSGLQFGKNSAGDIGILDLTTGTWHLLTVSEGDVPANTIGPALTYVHSNATLISDTDYVVLSQSGKLYKLIADVNATVASRGCVEIFNIRLFHGVTMFLSWGFLLPIGATIARFGKSWPHLFGAPAWFQLHRIIQSIGLLLGVAGFLAAVVPPMVGLDGFSATPHPELGVVITVLGVLQPVNAFFRPHPAKPGEKKPVKRLVWEIIHKYGGRTALILGMINPFYGLRFIQATEGYMIAYAIWFALIVTLYVVLTILGEPKASPVATFVNKTVFCKNDTAGGSTEMDDK